MTKDQEFGDIIDLGAATVETLGVIPGGQELSNPSARDTMGISDQD